MAGKIVEFFRHMFLPRGSSTHVADAFEHETEETRRAAENLTAATAGVIRKAHEEDEDPFAILVHQVKKASFRRMIKQEQRR